MLDSRPKGHGFEVYRRHCVVVLEQDTFILAKYWFNPGSPSRITERLLSGRKESNQTNKSITNVSCFVALLCSAMGCYTVSDFGISWPYPLTFFYSVICISSSALCLLAAYICLGFLASAFKHLLIHLYIIANQLFKLVYFSRFIIA